MRSRHQDKLRANREPSLESLLHDPVAGLVMRRDNLAPADILRVMARMRSRLRRQAGSRESAAAPEGAAC